MDRSTLPVRETPSPLPSNQSDPTRPQVNEPLLAVDNIQGNILAGFNKDHQTHIDLRVNEAKLEHFRKWLGRLVPFVATTNEVLIVYLKRFAAAAASKLGRCSRLG